MFRDGKADSSGKPGDLPDCESYYFFNPLGGVIEEEFSLYLHPFFAIVLTLTAFVSATGNQKDSTDTSAHSELDEMVVSGYRAGAVSASTNPYGRRFLREISRFGRFIGNCVWYYCT
jgi:hypothetical protein